MKKSDEDICDANCKDVGGQYDQSGSPQKKDIISYHDDDISEEMSWKLSEECSEHLSEPDDEEVEDSDELDKKSGKSFLNNIALRRTIRSTTDVFQHYKYKFSGVVSEPTEQEIEEDTRGFGESFDDFMNKLYAMADPGLTGLRSELTEADNEEEALTSESECEYILGTEEQEKATGWEALSKLPDPWAEARHPTPEIFSPDDLTNEDLTGELTLNTIGSGMCNLALPPGYKRKACTKLQLQSLSIKSIEILSKYKFLQYVDLSGNEIRDLSPLWTLPHLVVLDASWNQVDDQGFGTPSCSCLFLSYLNVSDNRLGRVPDLRASWALKHLNLANNVIGEIENLEDLEYLEYLNLSGNKLKIVSNLFNGHLKDVDLSNNYISEWMPEVTRALSRLKVLNLSNNKLTTTFTMKDFPILRKLDISYNNLYRTVEFVYLKNLESLWDLSVVGNNIDTIMSDVRKLIIYNNPNLLILNCMPVHYKERANAVMQFNLSQTTEIFSRDVTTFYRKHCVSPFDYSPKSVGCHPAIVVVVSFLGCNRADIVLKCHRINSWKIKLIRQVCTKPKLIDPITGKCYSNALFKHVSPRKFYKFESDGKFMSTFVNLGYKFGIPYTELNDTQHVLLTMMSFSAAVELLWEGYNPILVLLFPENTELLKDMILDWLENTKGARAKGHARQSLEAFSNRKKKNRLSKSKMRPNSLLKPEETLDGTLDCELRPERKVSRKPFNKAGRKMRYGIDTIDFSVTSLRKRYKKLKKMNKKTIMENPHIPFYRTSGSEEERYIEHIMKTRDAYLKEHQTNPGLFKLYIPSDDPNIAVEKLNKVIDEAYKDQVEKKNASKVEVQFSKDPLFDEMVSSEIRKYVSEVMTNRFPSELIH